MSDSSQDFCIPTGLSLTAQIGLQSNIVTFYFFTNWGRDLQKILANTGLLLV